jgi:hypothetical protein
MAAGKTTHRNAIWPERGLCSPSGFPGVGVVDRPGSSSGTSAGLDLLLPSLQDMVVVRMGRACYAGENERQGDKDRLCR